MIIGNTLVNESYQCDNVDQAFSHWYDILSNLNESLESRDGEVAGEVINAVTVINDPTRCIMTNGVRKMPMRYAVGEMLWYLSGNNNLCEIQKYTKAWDRMSDDGKTVNSNYGYCIKYKYGFDQWEYVKKLLSEDSNTRQAVLHIKTAELNKSKDVNCTVCCQFFIRDKKLYMTTYMRSNDLWMGFPYDVFQFTAMQILMSMQLGIELGTYTHIAGSLHLYKRNVIKLDSLNEGNKNEGKN
jgi:thymidylate synthase